MTAQADPPGRKDPAARADSPQPGGVGRAPREELALAHRLLDIRREELENHKREALVRKAAIEAARVQEEHQFEVASRNQDLAAASQTQLFRVTWAAFGLLAVIVLLFIGMAFFGNETQRSVAIELGRHGLIAVAGYGLFSALGRLRFRSKTQ